MVQQSAQPIVSLDRTGLVAGRLYGLVNPLFNRVRDALLTPDTLEQACRRARLGAERHFQPTRPANIPHKEIRR